MCDAGQQPGDSQFPQYTSELHATVGCNLPGNAETCLSILKKYICKGIGHDGIQWDGLRPATCAVNAGEMGVSSGCRDGSIDVDVDRIETFLGHGNVQPC